MTKINKFKSPVSIFFVMLSCKYHTRIMSNVICYLKIWMFNTQFKMVSKEIEIVHEVCLFTESLIFMKSFISASQASYTHYYDLMFNNLYLNTSSYIYLFQIHHQKNFQYFSDGIMCLALFDTCVNQKTQCYCLTE